MNKVVIKDSAKFREVIENIEAVFPRIQDAFQSENRNSESMNGEGETWKGQSQEKLYEKYQELAKNFTPIEETIALYIRFLKKTLEDYEALEQQTNNMIEEYANNQMDVNS